MRKTRTRTLQAGLLLLLAASSATGCSAVGDKVKQGLKSSEGSGGASVPEGPGMSVPPAPVEPGAVAVSHFRQILASMSSTLGLAPPPECTTLYRNSATTFPKYGVANEITAPEEGNKVALAACLCDGVYAKESAAGYSGTRTFTSQIDFVNGASSAVLSGPVADRLAKGILGRSVDSTEQSAISALLSGVEPTAPGGASRTPAAKTRVGFVNICTVLLASYDAQAK